MGESGNIRDIVERVVSASVDAHVKALKQELIEQACRELEKVASSKGADNGASNGAIDLLNSAIKSILDSFTQAEILGSLLDGTSKFATRAALFVVRGGAGTGWRAMGTEHDEAIKAITLNLNAGMAGRAYLDRVSAAGPVAEFDPLFVSTYGAPSDGGSALVLPLVVRDKVAALLYADAGLRAGGKLDGSALETLVHCTGMWLEIVAARKSGTSAPVESESHTQAVAETASEPAAYAEREAQVAAHHGAPAEVAAEPAFRASAAAAATATAVAMSPEDEEIHKKAKRFAKLLVDEIKLYNQSKVVEGRAHKDLYTRLKDDIDKSRATYDKRYGSSPAAAGNYFTQELIRILANDDPALLGSGFVG